MSASAVLRRRLATRLRDLRVRAGLSQDEIIDRANVDRRTIVRAESGEITLSARYLARYLDVCGVDRETRAELLELGTQARKRGGWWVAYKDLYAGPYLQLEAEASEVCNYEPLLVPGLLQTPEYMRVAMRSTSEAQVERHIEARQRRQERVTSGALTVRAVLDEAVLWRMGAGAAAHGQLEYLLDMAALPNVDIRVVPWSAGVYPGTRFSLAILRFPETVDPDLAMTETAIGERYADDADEVAALDALYHETQAAALSQELSADLVRTHREGR